MNARTSLMPLLPNCYRKCSISNPQHSLLLLWLPEIEKKIPAPCHDSRMTRARHLYIPVTIYRSLKKQYRFLCVFELAIKASKLGSYSTEAGIWLEGKRPSFRFLIHHLKNISTTFLRCRQFLFWIWKRNEKQNECSIKLFKNFFKVQKEKLDK